MTPGSRFRHMRSTACPRLQGRVLGYSGPTVGMHMLGRQGVCCLCLNCSQVRRSPLVRTRRVQEAGAGDERAQARMRVALLPSAYSPAVGGVEELTHRLATRLIAAGEEVEVWTHRHPRHLASREVIEGVEVRRVPLPLPAADPREFLAGGVGALREFLALIRRFDPHVLHVECFSTNGAYATGLSPLAGIPLVVSLQGETLMDDGDIYDRSRTLRLALRLGLRRAAAVTACSSFVLEDAERRFGLAAGRGLVVANGVELGGSAPSAPARLPFDRFVFAVGRMVEKKGFDLLIEAFKHVSHARPDVGLVIGGDGPVRAELAAKVNELALADRVLLTGRLTRDEVASLMHTAEVFVLPSRLEPFGIVVLEALKAGCPVVVSSRGGAQEIVRDGQQGFLVDPFNATAMAAAIRRLLGDAKLRRCMANEAVRRAEDFSWALISEQYRDIYRRVITDQSDGRRRLEKRLKR